MFFGGLQGFECTEVAPLFRFWVSFAGEQPVFPGF
jgi:hypothetical protein